MAVLNNLERSFAVMAVSGPHMCAWCELPILQVQDEWNWQFGGPVGMLRMHTDCALDWINRLMPDINKLEELQEEFNDD